MSHVSIIGTGAMGQAIASVAAKGGHSVQLLGQADDRTAVQGDVVVLAVPYPAVSGVLATRGESLAGRIVVDITNPLDFETFDSLTVAADGSATEEIAAKLGVGLDAAQSVLARAKRAFHDVYGALTGGLGEASVLHNEVKNT